MGFRYIGSKSNVIEEVINKINQVAPGAKRVIDLMSGTATVSLQLRKAGYTVTAVDVMTYSFHHAVVSLLFKAVPEFEGAREFISSQTKLPSLFGRTPYERIIEKLGDLEPVHGYFYKEFSLGGKPLNGTKPRNYFSFENAAKIDAIRLKIRDLYAEGKLSDLEHSLLLHDLIMASNDVANIAGTYGHYLAELNGRAKTKLQLKKTYLYTENNTPKHRVMKGFAENLAKDLSADICYIDPPYMKRQYAANYHILETLAREDEPEAVGVSGLRPWRDQYSNFCTKTKIKGAFSKIFNDMKCGKFLISYSEDGLLALDDLVEFMSGFGKVNVSKFSNVRFKSNNSRLAKNLTEYLIYLSK